MRNYAKNTGNIYATQHKEVLQINKKNGPMDKVHKPEIHQGRNKNGRKSSPLTIIEGIPWWPSG